MLSPLRGVTQHGRNQRLRVAGSLLKLAGAV